MSKCHMSKSGNRTGNYRWHDKLPASKRGFAGDTKQKYQPLSSHINNLLDQLLYQKFKSLHPHIISLDFLPERKDNPWQEDQFWKANPDDTGTLFSTQDPFQHTLPEKHCVQVATTDYLLYSKWQRD